MSDGAVNPAAEAKVVRKTAVEQMDIAAISADISARFRSDIFQAAGGLRVIEYVGNPFRLGLVLLGRVIF